MTQSAIADGHVEHRGGSRGCIGCIGGRAPFEGRLSARSPARIRFNARTCRAVTVPIVEIEVGCSEGGMMGARTGVGRTRDATGKPYRAASEQQPTSSESGLTCEISAQCRVQSAECAKVGAVSYVRRRGRPASQPPSPPLQL